jgi:transposase
MLVIYTDGITEAMNVKSEQFGEAKLVEVIKENAHLTPSEFVEKLNESIAQFTRGAEQNDDITVVAIKEKMQAENVVFNFRKKLIALVEKKGLSVAEACRKMNISTNTYYRYKKIFDEKGHAGLKPVKSKKRDDVRELTIGQKEAVLDLVKKHPEFGPARLTEALGKTTNPPVKVDQRVVFDFLKRKNLGSVKERESFSVNEVDTV